MAARVWIVASISRIHWKVCSSRLLRVYERLIESGLSSFASACMPGRAGRQTHACSAYHQRQSFSALAASSRASHQLMQLPRRVGARTSQDHNRGSGARQLHRSCGSAGVEPGAPRGGGCRCVRRLCAPCPAVCVLLPLVLTSQLLRLVGQWVISNHFLSLKLFDKYGLRRVTKHCLCT